MYGCTLAISRCVKTSNIQSKFITYIDVPLFKAVTSSTALLVVNRNFSEMLQITKVFVLVCLRIFLFLSTL